MPVATLADAPDTILLSSGTPRSRVQVAKTGRFEDPRYGKFSITLQDFDQWERNFIALHLSDGREGMPVDVDHSPETRGDTEAAGWVKKLDRMGDDGRTPTPNELWATVEWNSLGEQLLKDKRYAYLSPSYNAQYKDEHGKQWGNVMAGIALTNRPFLRMATVSLSRAGTAEWVSDSPRQMPELNKELLLALGVPEDKVQTILTADDQAAALSAATAAKPSPEAKPPVEKAPEPRLEGGKTLAQYAKESGMVLMSGSDVAKLAADAASGAAAAAELHTGKFESAFTLAVKDGKVLPAAKSTFELAYSADATATLKALSDLPKVVHTTLRGGTGDPMSPVMSRELHEDIAGENFTAPDDERVQLHERTLAMVAEKNIPYDEAMFIVAEQVGA